jgi:hypothetical protein
VTEQLRIGDAERERAAADLGEHFAQGRLTADEHAERLELVWAARTQADLVPLFRDLPGGAYGFRPAVQARSEVRRREPGWRRRFPVPAFVVLPLIVLTIAFHAPFLFFGLAVLFLISRGGPRRRYGWR